MAAFIDLGPDWLDALATFNPTTKPRLRQPTDWVPALNRLSGSDRDTFLRRLLTDDPTTVRTELKRHLRSLLPADPLQSPRHQLEFVAWREIREKAMATRKEREDTAREEAETLERAYVQFILGNEDRLWKAAQSAIETKSIIGYDRAVALLKLLEDLAQSQGTGPVFLAQVRELLDRFPRLTGMRGRVKQAELVDPPKPLFEHYDYNRWKKTYGQMKSEIMAGSFPE